MPKGRRRRQWLVPLAAGCLILATTGVTSALAPLRAVAATAKAPILVGGITATSEFPGVTQGFAARVARANRQGGVDGHQIKIVENLDDGNSETTDLTDAQKLILSDHVAIIAPVGTVAFDNTSGAFAVSHKTPFLGLGTTPPFCGTSNKWGWGFNGCLIGSDYYNTSLFSPIIKQLGGPSKVKVAIFENNTTLGTAATTVFDTVLKLLHTKVVLNFVEHASDWCY